MTYNGKRTEKRQATTLKVGDHIVDPKHGRGILTIFNIEPLGSEIWIDAMKGRRVVRKVWANDTVEVYI